MSAQLTHELVHKASGHTEKVSAATLKLLTDSKKIKLYDVTELKAPVKPAESIGEAAPAKTDTKPKAGAGV